MSDDLAPEVTPYEVEKLNDRTKEELEIAYNQLEKADALVQEYRTKLESISEVLSTVISARQPSPGAYLVEGVKGMVEICQQNYQDCVNDGRTFEAATWRDMRFALEEYMKLLPIVEELVK